MILKRILIKKFGGFQDKSIELSSGINVFYGMNEVEKNTVSVFVKSMFFGVPEECEGIIWFRAGDKNYRLTRESGLEPDNCQLFCEDTQTLLEVENGTVERLLGGISETVFENVVLVEALLGNSSAEMAKGIQNKHSVLSKCVREPGTGTVILRLPGFWKVKEIILSTDRNTQWRRMILSFLTMWSLTAGSCLAVI